MEYILLTIFMLICGACIANLFIQAEAEKRTIIYEEGKFIKIIKYRNGQVVSRKIYTGRLADILYKILG